MDTPFIYNRYTTGKFFVGRKNECSILTNLLKKNENVVLYSPPKTGKMSVIQQTLYNMRSGGHRFRIAHARMFNIESVNSFATKFGEAVIRACGNSPADYKNIISTYLADTHFIFDEDRYSAQDEALSLNWDADQNDMLTIFALPERIAEDRGEQVITIIEDVDQLLNLKELEYEAVLKNINTILTANKEKEAKHSCIIFTGSHVNGMKHIFEYKKYLRRLVEHLPLAEVDDRDIIEHLVKGFLTSGKVIDRDLALGASKLFKEHLWYINHFASICDSMTKGYINEGILMQALNAMLAIHQPYFITLMNDLTGHQKSLLKAVLDGVVKFSATEIIEKYALNSSANVKRVKDALTKKEIITFNEKDEPIILDPLFEYWLRNHFYEKR